MKFKVIIEFTKFIKSNKLSLSGETPSDDVLIDVVLRLLTLNIIFVKVMATLKP